MQGIKLRMLSIKIKTHSCVSVAKEDMLHTSVHVFTTTLNISYYMNCRLYIVLETWGMLHNHQGAAQGDYVTFQRFL